MRAIALLIGLGCVFAGHVAPAAPVFSRSLSPLAGNFGNLFRGGSLDLTANIPQTIANFSRISAANNRNVGNGQEINLRGFVTDPRSGFTIQQFRLDPFTGLFQSRPADAFGNRFNGFSFGGIDNEALRQAEKFVMENLLSKTVNNLEKRLRGFNNQDILEITAAVNLARRTLGPDLSRGVLKVQCQDIMGTAVNNEEGAQINKDYLALDPNPSVARDKRCVALLSQALNHLKPFGKPPVVVNLSMLRGGVLTVPNLLRTFSLPALGTIFKRSDNTNVCNFERTAGTPAWSLEDVVMQAMNPNIYNLVKGFDPEDVNRNLFLETGVNLALPRQLQGAAGVAAGLFASNLTDIAFIDGRDSGVAKSGLNREIRAWANSVGRMFFTFDTNAEKSGVQLAAQNVRQGGRNTLGFGQGEGYRMDPFGSIDWVLTAAPDENGKVALANEVPATAAHAGAISPGSTSAAIVAGQCIQCHKRGTQTNNGKGSFALLAVGGTNTVANLSSNFSNAMAQYENFKKITNSYIPDTENGGSHDILWDAYQKIKMPKSIDYAANQVGLSGNQLRAMMVQDPSLSLKLQLNQQGNLDTQNWLGGGKCAIKFALNGRRGGGFASGALASASGPSATIAETKKPAIDTATTAEPHI